MARKESAHGNYRAPFGKARIATWLSYVAVLTLSVLASCYELIFDFDGFDATKFATKLSISMCIAIMGLLMSIKDGKDTNEGKRFGDYYEAKKAFADKIASIANKEWFKQWADGVLYPRERKSAIMAILNEDGVDDYAYMQVSDEDLKALESGPRMCAVGRDGEGKPIERPLEPLSKRQSALVRSLRAGFKFKQLDYTYFTSATDGSGYSYYANLKEKQQRRKAFALFYRVLMIIMTTSIFALAVINPHGEDIGQVAFDTVGRITTLLSSVVMGYCLANDEMRENMDSMAFKAEKIDEYLVEKESGSFVPKSKDEIVRAKIEEIERRKKKEAERAGKTSEDNPPKKEDPPTEDVVEIEMTEDELAAFSATK